jgi:osmotically inducible lipoprotein OsmB
MKTLRSTVVGTVAIAVVLGLGACSGMSKQGQNTATGAAIGGVAGAVLTNGSPAGTVGGAAIGGVIGHEIRKTK